jgi:hypothetical protein
MTPTDLDAAERAATEAPRLFVGTEGYYKVQALAALVLQLVADARARAWQPISTAPFGEYVLAAVPDYGVMKVVKLDGGWLTMTGTRINPTHWMPLPEPPSEPPHE